MASVDTRVTARRTLTVIGLVLATALLLYLVMHTTRVLVWILVAVFFAVALNPAVNWMQRRMSWCKRWLATLLIFLLVFLVIAGLVTVFIVPLIREGGQLYDQFPQIIADVRAGRGPIGNLAERFNILDYAKATPTRSAPTPPTWARPHWRFSPGPRRPWPASSRSSSSRI